MEWRTPVVQASKLDFLSTGKCVIIGTIDAGSQAKPTFAFPRSFTYGLRCTLTDYGDQDRPCAVACTSADFGTAFRKIARTQISSFLQLHSGFSWNGNMKGTMKVTIAPLFTNMLVLISHPVELIPLGTVCSEFAIIPLPSVYHT